MPIQPTAIDLCVCTYRRPEGLSRLLDAVAGLDLLSPHRIDFQVILVDNDPEGPLEVRRSLPGSCRVLHQPTRGIPFARNAGLDAVRPDADFVAFIDDDEAPAPDWLQHLLTTQRQFSLDAVTGPVKTQRPKTVVGAWLHAAGAYDREEYDEGALLPRAGTNNALVDAQWIRRPESLRFNEAIGLGGGSDDAFFRGMVRRGGRIGFSKSAVVTEWLDPDRQTLRWVAKRHYRYGLAEAQQYWRDAGEDSAALSAFDAARARASKLPRAVRLLGVGTRELMKCAWKRSAERAVMGFILVSRGVGVVAGIAGLKDEYYR